MTRRARRWKAGDGAPWTGRRRLWKAKPEVCGLGPHGSIGEAERGWLASPKKARGERGRDAARGSATVDVMAPRTPLLPRFTDPEPLFAAGIPSAARPRGGAPVRMPAPKTTPTVARHNSNDRRRPKFAGAPGLTRQGRPSAWPMASRNCALCRITAVSPCVRGDGGVRAVAFPSGGAWP